MEEGLKEVGESSVAANGRGVCSGRCGRPLRVCLCDEMPAEPISTQTHLLILQHPHEKRHRLATLPLLSRCLNTSHFSILTGRRIRLGSSPLLDHLYHQRTSQSLTNPPRRSIFLFPGTDSMPSTEIAHWKSSITDNFTEGCVLIVFDGTWKHAKEMVTASLPFISTFASCVCFDYDLEVCGGSIFDSELLLRKEPFRGCISTMEAVARALKVLEPNGLEIERNLLAVLKAMVRFQASHLKPMNPRPKLLKKKKNREEEKLNDNNGRSNKILPYGISPNRITLSSGLDDGASPRRSPSLGGALPRSAALSLARRLSSLGSATQPNFFFQVEVSLY